MNIIINLLGHLVFLCTHPVYHICVGIFVSGLKECGLGLVKG